MEPFMHLIVVLSGAVSQFVGQSWYTRRIHTSVYGGIDA